MKLSGLQTIQMQPFCTRVERLQGRLERGWHLGCLFDVGGPLLWRWRSVVNDNRLLLLEGLSTGLDAFGLGLKRVLLSTDS